MWVKPHIGKMKLLQILAVFLLFACTIVPFQTLDELIAEAEVTGDWTKVNKKLDVLEKKEAENASNCPSNKTEICKNGHCQCLAKRHMSDFIRP